MHSWYVLAFMLLWYQTVFFINPEGGLLMAHKVTTSHRKFSEWKQAHLGMELSKTSQTRWEWHHNTFTPSLHLVPFCQLPMPYVVYIYITLLSPRVAHPCFIKVTGWLRCSQTSTRSSVVIMGIHCYFTQEDRRAFKATPVESIYATLSEVSGHILLWYKNKVGCFGTTLPILPPPRASMLLLGQTPRSLRRLPLTGVLPRTLRASTSS